MAIPPIFIFLSFCIIISQEASVNHAPFKSVKPVSFMSFNNKIGTYIEYKGQVGIDIGEKSLEVFYTIEPYYSFQELLVSGFKALTKYVSLSDWREMTAQPYVNELFETFHNLNTINDSRDNNITWRSFVDKARSVNKQTLESYKGFPFKLLVDLINMSSDMDRRANILLEKIKGAQLNIPFLLDKRTLNDIRKDINATIHDIFKVTTISVGNLDNKTVAFEYKYPKIDSDQFSIYRLTPIPKVHRNGTIEILDIDAPYLAINKMTERYFELYDLEHCLKLEHNRFICKPPKVSKITSLVDLPCGVAAVQNQSSAACTSHLVVRQSLWTPLLAPNSWMATVTKEASLLALCSADDYELQLKINGSGILQIRSDCTVRLGTSTELRGEHRERTDFNLAYASLHTKTETAMIVDLFQSHVDQVIWDSISKLKEDKKPGTIEHPYFIGTGVLLTILAFLALLYCHLRPQPRNDVNLNDAYQQRPVHFRS